jgi:uncharacterized protein
MIDPKIPYARSAQGRTPGVLWKMSVEGVGGVARLAKKLSVHRVLFGTHYPLFYFESAVLKVREAEFTEAERQAVLDSNALRLLAT